MAKILGSQQVSDELNKEFYILVSYVQENLHDQNWEAAKDYIDKIQKLEQKAKATKN